MIAIACSLHNNQGNHISNMDGPLHHQWMYRRRNPNGHGLRDEWLMGVNMFDEFARNQEEYRINGVYRCPCVKCKNM